MNSALAPVAALLIGVAVLMTGQGLQGTLVPVRAGLENFSTISIGLIGAGYFLGFTLGCLKSGGLVRRVGHVRVFAAMTALASAVPLIHGMWPDPWVWGLLRIMTGFCFAVLYVVIESWLNERATNENRGIIFSTYVVINLTVLAAGQLMLLFYDPMRLRVFAIASVLVSLAAIPVAMSTAQSPEQPQSVDLNIGKLYRNSPAGTLGCLVAGLANGSFWSLAPVFTAGYSTDISLASWYMTSGVIGGALGQWPLGYLSDKLGRRQVLVVAAAGGTVLAVAIVLMGDNLSFWTINLLGAAWGAMAFPLYSISVAHANDYAEADDYVRISSGLLLMYGAGAVVGPFAASAVMTATGVSGLYWFSGAVHGFLVGYVALRALRREPAPAEQHMPFSDVLATTYTASSVYEEEIQQHDADVEPDESGVAARD